MQKFLLAVTAPLVMLVALELILRTAGTGHLYFREKSPHFINENGFALRPHYKGWWHGARYEINADGFRMPEDVDMTVDAVRILALGDSVTEGYCVTDVRDIWPMRLQAKLDDKRERAFYVINSGTAAWNLLVPDGSNGMKSAQYVHFMRTKARTLNPDIVIYCICMNDIPGRVNTLFEIDNAHNKAQFRLFPEKWRAFLKRQTFYRLARDWYREQRFRSLDYSAIPTPDSDADYWKRITAELADLKTAVENSGATLACVIWPYSYQMLPANRDLLRITGNITAALSECGIPYRDMTSALNEDNVLSYYVLGDYIHPNPNGHELIAEAAASLIHDLSGKETHDE